MAKMNVWKRMFPARTHEGAVAQKVDAKSELRRAVLICLLWEDTFYEKGNDIAKRIAALAAENKPEVVAALAREARSKMQLRHAPLFLTRELARRKGAGPLVAGTLEDVIQRADELGEFVSLYWKEKKQPLSAGDKARAGAGVHEVRRLPACEVRPRVGGQAPRRAVPLRREAQGRSAGCTLEEAR
jgi:hypothetical protein